MTAPSSAGSTSLFQSMWKRWCGSIGWLRNVGSGDPRLAICLVMYFRNTIHDSRCQIAQESCEPGARQVPGWPALHPVFRVRRTVTLRALYDLIIVTEYAVIHLSHGLDRRNVWPTANGFDISVPGRFLSVVFCLDHEFMANRALRYQREFCPPSRQRV